MSRIVRAFIPYRLASPAQTPPISRPSRGRVSALMVFSFVSGFARFPLVLGAMNQYSRGTADRTSVHGPSPTLGILGVLP
ncbi:hypothetical protein GCM10010302_50460 [Streptomyces polychromogenes]|uniref:MFS transporter n=1 Tax=Streptomyces polychromogenes TaxID=67342 RepID=A0ABN0VIR1_9ACTN